MNTTYKFDVVEGSDGDQILQLTDQFCKEQDWREGDVISWDIKDGAVVATNKCALERKKSAGKKLVLVEAVSLMRMRYVVECDEEEHAMDEVIMKKSSGDFYEFSQQHLDEVITSTRILTKEDYIELFNKDNDYIASWDDEEKFRYINKINYNE